MRSLKIAITAIMAATIASCAVKTNSESASIVLRDKLSSSVENGHILFGHQDSYFYGHNWTLQGKQNHFDHTDIFEVCSKQPSVLGMDLGGIELGDTANLDGVDFGTMREAAITHHAKGGVVTFSWHPRNPLTGGDAWDTSDSTVVHKIVSGDRAAANFAQWMERLGDFLESLKTVDGKAVPFIFRPWHEHTGSWFWWGRDLCSTEDYKALWHLTYDYLGGERKMDNILWAYSPNAGVNAETYMERYPGDGIVDIMGFDSYCFNSGTVEESSLKYGRKLREDLEMVAELAKEHGKLLALTECGYEGIPYPNWWTESLYKAIEGMPVCYVLTWRNAFDKPGHFYGPWHGADCEENFIEFTSKSDIVLLNE